MRAAICAVLLLIGAPIHAQTVALWAGHVIDPRTGTVASDQMIFVADGIITRVEAHHAGSYSVPVIDLSRSWVLPGLFDVHTHLTLSSMLGDVPFEALYLKESTSYRALRGLHNAQLLLAAGFTTVRDVGNGGDYGMQAVGKALDQRWFIGPTIVSAGKMIAPFGGQSVDIPPEQGPVWHYEYIDADSPEEMRKAVRQNIFYGAGVIKLVADNSPYVISPEEMRAAVDEAHQAGVPVAVHVYGGRAAQIAIEAGVDSIEHGHLLTDEQLRLMKAKGIFLVGTDFPRSFLEAAGKASGVFTEEPAVMSREIVDRLRRAARLGVKMAFGTDIFLDLPGRSRTDIMFDYLGVWREAGVPNAQILRCMTSNAAELMRMEHQRGTVAAGYAADIVATPADPLSDIEALRRIDFVMKAGSVIRSPPAR